MKKYLVEDEWEIIEDGLQPEFNLVSESIFSLGNGYMGLRGNFEETYSGPSLQGTYIAGIYYPDKTKVGWWKVGYPAYFAKVLNACNWIGIRLWIDQDEVDLYTADLTDFSTRLNMQEGMLYRSCILTTANKKRFKIETERFCSMHQKELAGIQYKISAINQSADIKLDSYLDFDVKNNDANYDEKFWISVDQASNEKVGYVIATTKKTNFSVCVSMHNSISINHAQTEYITTDKKSNQHISLTLGKDSSLTLHKYISVVHSQNHLAEELITVGNDLLQNAVKSGYSLIKYQHIEWWAKKWHFADIQISGDVAAQQGIRFNIFQMFQTYTGDDARLNVGPKGFTGEKYGGSTYWDTEAYCLPFYLSTAPQQVAKNLLLYRYQHLDKAIENAALLGFTDGAALYPMVTMNGEESHNEWEITFEEIHRNGAIAYAIYDYIRYTGDEDYLAEAGLVVLIAISRFWAQRMHYSEDKNMYVILGVTGPNEYENNVNNNWYTNYIASWCMRYTMTAIETVANRAPHKLAAIKKQVKWDDSEQLGWSNKVQNIYYPEDKELGIWLQQDGFLDKEIIPVADLDVIHRPLHKKWSWDRILRSCYIKQADVLQGLYFFEDDFSKDQIARNFKYYEPLTVHESSLSPCVHSILAAQIGDEDKAYEMYLRTARLDLDDYNSDTEAGCHITSMAGTWLSIVKGFGGMRIKDNEIHFNPFIPKQWSAYSFNIGYRSQTINVDVRKDQILISNLSDRSINVHVFDHMHTISANKQLSISHV